MRVFFTLIPFFIYYYILPCIREMSNYAAEVVNASNAHTSA